MLEKIYNAKTRLVFLFIVLFELLSILAAYSESFMVLCFFVFLAIFVLLSFYKLEYGVYIVFIELIIGSKGYLLHFDTGSFIISLRIGLWVSIMSVWFIKAVIEYLQKNKKNEMLTFFRSWIFKFYFFLALFVLWGLVNALLRGNEIKNVILDFNAWLFFLLVFPVFAVINKKDFLVKFSQIVFASISWIIMESLVLLYIFSHQFNGLSSYLYKWVRDTGVGEITAMNGDFYRIFFQSHIYIVIVSYLIFFLIVYFLNKNKISNIFNYKKIIKVKEKRHFFILIILFSLLLAINILSLSRSNWVGLFFGAIICALIILFKFKFRTFLNSIVIFIFSFLLGLMLILLLVKFPLPHRNNSFSATGLLTQRASNIKNEAGASSRWSLLPVLWSKINENPFMGKGFGETLTYKTSDPRILEKNKNGNYTTYAFEWGWHDIWLKIGLFGLFAYLLLLFKIFIPLNYIYFKKVPDLKDYIYIAMAVGLLSIMVIHFFSPYLNHPLGIGYLIIISAIFSNLSKKYTHK